MCRLRGTFIKYRLHRVSTFENLNPGSPFCVIDCVVKRLMLQNRVEGGEKMLHNQYVHPPSCAVLSLPEPTRTAANHYYVTITDEQSATRNAVHTYPATGVENRLGRTQFDQRFPLSSASFTVDGSGCGAKFFSSFGLL